MNFIGHNLKRFIDIFVSAFGLFFSSPILLPVVFIVWFQDFKSPFYIAPRMGVNERTFKMIKLRSMIVDADKTGVDSTSANDSRITSIGRFIRKYKLDELTQLINVLRGDMSLVGPRPNVENETKSYTDEEKILLTVRPGITDFSSIVFSDEGDILEGSEDPDLLYNQIIRPWKSRLGLLYIEKSNIILDIKIIILTAIAILNKEKALKSISNILTKLGADEKIIKVSLPKDKLIPDPPPGSDKVVNDRV